MPQLTRSAWKYKTSDSQGFGVGVFGWEKGNLVLLDPSGAEVTIEYGGVGEGRGRGLKLPKAVQDRIAGWLNQEFAGGFSLYANASDGEVFRTPWCRGLELDTNSFRGGAVFGQLSLAGGVANSLTAFLLGVTVASMVAAMDKMAGVKGSGPAIPADIHDFAPQAVVMSEGSGFGVGAGLALFIGAATVA